MSLTENRFPSTASMFLPLLALTALVVSWNSQILSTLTFEAAMFFGLFLSPASFFAGVCRGAHRATRTYMQGFTRESYWVFGSLFGVFIVLWLHGTVFKSCSSSSGSVPFLLAIVPQLLLSVSTGLWIGRLVGKMRTAIIVAVLLCVLYLVVQVALWWYRPSLRFFEPYWLFIVGDLVRGQSMNLAVVVYKLSNLLLAFALIGMGVHTKFHATKFWVVLSLFCGAFLGQWQSSSWISPSYQARQQNYPDVLQQGSLILHTNLEMLGKAHSEARITKVEMASECG